MGFELCQDVHRINLRLPESERWNGVTGISRETRAAMRLYKEAKKDILDTFGGSTMMTKLLANGFSTIVETVGMPYVGEIKAWAEALDVDPAELVALNCSYEIAHAADVVLGCTVGMEWHERQGMRHYRTLDWPLPSIGPATRIFEFVSGKRKFYVVGMPGFVGALSGMVPGGYSVAINWAPPVGRPGFEIGPAFLLRQVLETCDNYAAAVDMLCNSPLATSVFFSVAGTKRSEACVIERTSDEYAVRRIRRSILAHANHYVTREFQELNYDPEEGEMLVETSEERQELMADVGEDAFRRKPVNNEDTVQRIIFNPGRGELAVWRRR